MNLPMSLMKAVVLTIHNWNKFGFRLSYLAETILNPRFVSVKMFALRIPIKNCSKNTIEPVTKTCVEQATLKMYESNEIGGHQF